MGGKAIALLASLATPLFTENNLPVKSTSSGFI